MSSGSKLDQIVKGAPPPGTSVPSVASRSASPAPLSFPDLADGKSAPGTAPQQPTDPVASLPSSPPQIYLNLLILEASLRSQYLTLRIRRSQHTFFVLLLTAWTTGFFYALFLRPREDGSGVGGSVYWVVETAEKVVLMGGIVTGILLWGTGQWDRGVRWPRRWVGIANRGLRNINAKIVIIKGPWWKEMARHMSFLFPYSALFASHGPYLHYAEPVTEKQSGRQRHADSSNVGTVEDLSPGGDYLKLLLLPKPFSPDFRENWEMYRLEYWDKENERRAQLRRQFLERQRHLARDQGKWFWWTGWRRPRLATSPVLLDMDLERTHVAQVPKESKRRRSFLRTDSHSRNTSRSSTPASLDGEDYFTSGRGRRGSSNHASNSERRKKLRSKGSADMTSFTKVDAQGHG
ncbi:MAG: hypothetical protein L6R40_003627 [Gallowayella cf. fulva]|nr:MAG: hypothetical protein L6R40_003627 [Xanthomendoza cf. fulva]